MMSLCNFVCVCKLFHREALLLNEPEVLVKCNAAALQKQKTSWMNSSAVQNPDPFCFPSWRGFVNRWLHGADVSTCFGDILNQFVENTICQSKMFTSPNSHPADTDTSSPTFDPSTFCTPVLLNQLYLSFHLSLYLSLFCSALFFFSPGLPFLFFYMFFMFNDSTDLALQGNQPVHQPILFYYQKMESRVWLWPEF